jgi:hypothetical protein
MSTDTSIGPPPIEKEEITIHNVGKLTGEYARKNKLFETWYAASSCIIGSLMGGIVMIFFPIKIYIPDGGLELQGLSEVLIHQFIFIIIFFFIFYFSLPLFYKIIGYNKKLQRRFVKMKIEEIKSNKLFLENEDQIICAARCISHSNFAKNLHDKVLESLNKGETPDFRIPFDDLKVECEKINKEETAKRLAQREALQEELINLKELLDILYNTDWR